MEKQRPIMTHIFHLADTDGSDSLSRHEVEEFLSGEDVLTQLGLDDHADPDKADDEMGEEKLDVNRLRMEFSMVFDALDQGNDENELSCQQFIEAFEELKSKRVSPEQVAMQQEIYKLRTILSAKIEECASRSARER